MAFEKTKVYYDGSHYIGIPHNPSMAKRGVKAPEETIVVTEPEETENSTASAPAPVSDASDKDNTKPRSERRITRTELFEELYKKYQGEKRKARKELIVEAMKPYFKSETEARQFVEVNMERKKRNLICRRQRMSRKANLQEFNYFVTFTYDGKLHTEESFKNKLRHTLSNFSKRKGWKYIGVWERSPTTQRLHFHGLFYIPEGTMPGIFIQVEDYSTTAQRKQITNQSVYFNERFGRSDFEPIDDPRSKGDAMAYLMKYIEKSGERIVYSKNLPMYFVADILDTDVLCRFGVEDRKLILADDFLCFDQGVLVGTVSPEVIEQMPKAYS